MSLAEVVYDTETVNNCDINLNSNLQSANVYAAYIKAYQIKYIVDALIYILFQICIETISSRNGSPL